MDPYPLRLVRIAAGLFLCAAGIYCSILANVGLAPWDALNMGLSGRLHVTYGTASVSVALLVLLADLLLREPIGLGTVLDALGVGKMVDLLQWLHPLHAPATMAGKAAFLLAGILIISIGQWLYMSGALGCGPRDALLVALGKKVRRVPIGAVTSALLAVVVCAAWLLGGPIGLGTVLMVALQGASLQLVCRVVHFEPRAVAHESLRQTIGKWTHQ